MLGIMRKYKESIIIKLVFIVIVLSFIGTIFLVWGRGDKSVGGSDYAAKVDGTKISIDEFQKSYYRLRGIYEQINGKGFTPEMEKQVGLKKLAIDSLIDTAIIRKEAGRMGISVNKDDIKKSIATISAFQKNGAFDFQQYQEVLRINRMSPSQFEDAQAQDLLIDKARQKIKDGAIITDEEIAQAFRKKNDKVDVSFISYSPVDLKGELKLTEQDLNSYLQAHQDNFKTPEQISVSFCIIDPSFIAKKLTLSEQEAQTYYQKNIDRYQGKGGILPYSEVQERVKEDALMFKGAKEAYEIAAASINKNKTGDLVAAATDLGVKVTETPLFKAAIPPPQFAGDQELIKRAFALKAGELGGPVETKKGIYILKLKDKKPAAVPPLVQIKAEVEQQARVVKLKELTKQMAEQAVGELAKSTSSLKLQETGDFGFNPTGEIPKIGISPQIMDTVFSLTASAPAAKTPFQVGDKWVAVRLKARMELNKENLPKEKDLIKESLKPRKQQEVVDKWLNDLKSKAKIEINPALLKD